MNRLLCTILFASAAWAGLATADRQVPTDIRANLLFPRSDDLIERTEWLPIIFGIQNLDAVWPIDAFLNVTVRENPHPPSNRSSGQPAQSFNLDFSNVTPEQILFHIPITNITNTTARFTISWEFGFEERCFDSEVDWRDAGRTHRWSNGPRGGRGPHEVDFYVDDSSLVPNITRSIIKDCEELRADSDTAVRITDLRHDGEANPGGIWGSTSGEQKCPVLDTEVEADRCSYRPFAEELAANVTEEILRLTGCEGTWDFREGCQQEDAAARFGAHWMFALAVAIAVGCNL